MRITFAIPFADLSGGNRVIAIHADRLRRRGHQVVVVSVSRPRPSLKFSIKCLFKGEGWPKYDPKPASHLDGLPLEHRRLPHPGPMTDADVPDADVIIGTWWETAEWVSRLSPSKGTKVHFVQGYDVHAGPPDRVNATYGLPTPKIVISNWLRQLLQNKFQQDPVGVVHNSVETDKFYSPERGKQPQPTIGMIYATDLNKGCDVMIKAYQLAGQQLPNLRLISMGLNRVAEELPLPPGVEYNYQARDDAVRQIYCRCDAWLSATREEGFGLPILEAMACRTPVIATPAGAAPELIAKGGGILVPHANPQAMADAIVKIGSMPDAEWRALSDTALATAASYTWEDASVLFEQALQTVTGKKNQSRDDHQG